MKKYIQQFLINGFVFLLLSNLSAQSIDKIINAAEVQRIEKVLSSDSMQGRKVFTPSIDKAADFIASEFEKSKIKKRKRQNV